MDAGQIIGNYIVERELGRGGMGVVYAAKHRVLGRPAAIKLLLSNTDDRDRVERFFNEARAAMAIDHPGIVKIYDVGVSGENRPYIAMELLDGTALSSLVAPAGLPIQQGIDYAQQIASALAAAHDAGVIHRDLKPENVIITRDRSRAIVVDFGIAKLSHVSTVRTATGALVGTPLYMSPEQCEGLRELDARADLYSFGCVLFAMFTGRPPFFEGGQGGIIGAHLHLPPPLLRTRCATASAALEQITSTLLNKKPDDRFRTARAVLAALGAPAVRELTVPGASSSSGGGFHSVQPWAQTPAISAPRVETMATGVGETLATGATMASGEGPAHSSIAHAHSPPIAHAHAPRPHASMTPPMSGPAPSSASRRKLVVALVAGSMFVVMIAITGSRGCGGGTSRIDAGVATGSGARPDAGGDTRVAIGTSTSPIDAAIAPPVDAAVAKVDSPRGSNTPAPSLDEPTGTNTTKPTGTNTKPTGTNTTKPTTTKTTTTKPTGTTKPAGVQINPNGPPLTTRPRNQVDGAGVANNPQTEQPDRWDPSQEVTRAEIHERIPFGANDFSVSLGQRVLDRVAANHRADPTRRIVITGRAEDNEGGANPEALASARANAAFTALLSRRVPRGVLVRASGGRVEPATSNGASRRVDIDFE